MTGDGLGPDEAVSALEDTIQQAGTLPSEVSYVDHEPGDGDRDVTLPILTLHPLAAARIVEFNTDFDGVLTDSDGNATGRVFTAEYRLDIQLDIWTASGSSYDERTLGSQLHDALYPHDTNGPGRPILDEDGNAIESVWKFRLNDGEQANDLTTTPAVRRWRQDISLWAYHRFDTSEGYITDIKVPTDAVGDDSTDDSTDYSDGMIELSE